MFIRFSNDMKKYWSYSLVSATCQLKAEVTNSYLNWLWWILTPTCFMLVYTLVFGYIFSAKEPFFPLFIFIGLAMWDFFSKTMEQSVQIVKKNKGIVSKVYLPKYILVLVKLWVNGFKMMISFGLVVFMMIVFHVELSWNIIYFVPLILLLALFSFGCAIHLMHYGVYIEDMSNVVTIFLRLLFYVTGIFYNIVSHIPPPYGALWVQCNPMAFLLSAMRDALLYQMSVDIALLLVWLLISCLLCLSGIRKIYKNENSYVKVI